MAGAVRTGLVALLLGGLLVVGAPAATPVAAAPAGIHVVRGRIVVDDVAGRVFATRAGAVAVYDLDGQPVATLPGLDGDVLLHEGTLYAVDRSAPRVVALDPGTLQEVGAWSTAATPAAGPLAWAGGRIWFRWQHGLASLDPATGELTPNERRVDGHGGPTIAGHGSRLHLLSGGTSGEIEVYDASGASPVLVARSPEGSTGCQYGEDLAVSVPGDALWTACGATRGVGEHDPVSPGAPRVTYPLAEGGAAVARSEDGRFVLAATHDVAGPDVLLFPVGQTSPVQAFEVGSADVALGMLAVDPGAQRAYAMTEDGVLHTWPLERPAAPTGVEAAWGADRATVSWTPPALDGGHPITGYVVTPIREGEPEPAVTVGPGATSTVVTGLAPERVYAFTVAALNGVGAGPSSEPSDEVRLRTMAPFSSWEEEVDSLFRWMVGRPPTAGEMSVWAGGLAAGTTAPGDLVAVLRGDFFEGDPCAVAPDSLTCEGSQAHRVDPVLRLYAASFQRPADRDGTQYWLARRRSGTSLRSVAKFFVASREFRVRYGTLSDGAFVDRVYRNVLGRAPDPSGRAFWVGELASGRRSRALVMVGFAGSREHRVAQAAATAASALWITLADVTPTPAQREQVTGALARGVPLADVARTVLADPLVAARAGG